jgi:hypothetical protein
MFKCFICYQRYVARVSYGCCKSRLRCCICCNGCTRMLQMSVPNVLSVFSDVFCKRSVFIWMLHMFHTYDVSVLFRCCVCVATVFKCFLDVFTSVSETCFKCFIYLQSYVASILSGCSKSRSGVLFSSSLSTVSLWCLLVFCCLASFLDY